MPQSEELSFAKSIEDKDGGLYCLSGSYLKGGYVSWSPGDETICLDGGYTIEQLKSITNFMEEKNATK